MKESTFNAQQEKIVTKKSMLLVLIYPIFATVWEVAFTRFHLLSLLFFVLTVQLISYFFTTAKGPSTNYAGKILSIFDPPPPP